MASKQQPLPVKTLLKISKKKQELAKKLQENLQRRKAATKHSDLKNKLK